MSKPLIGINMDYTPPGKVAGAQVRSHEGYARCVLAAGGMPVFLAPCEPDELDQDFLGQLDGMILAGSPLNLNPQRLSLETHPSVTPMPEKKWKFDTYLAQKCIDWNIPTLAIANGMLTLNHCLGGETYTHILTDLPQAIPHRDLTGGPHRHAVHIQEGSLLRKIYIDHEIRVNSYHSQAIKTPGKRIAATAFCHDGVIEGVESVDPAWFCIGLQWHPHSETSNALDVSLFNHFILSCDRSSDRNGEMKHSRKKL